MTMPAEQCREHQCIVALVSGGGCLGCQEQGKPLPPARHVAGVVAIGCPPESLHRQAGQNSEKQVKVLVSSPESLHRQAVQFSEKQVKVI